MLWNTVRTVFAHVLDIVFPPSNRTLRVRAKQHEPISLHIRAVELLGKTIHTLGSYDTPRMKDAIGAAKFERSIEAQIQLAHILDDYLIDAALEHAYGHHERIIVVPVPLHHTRKQERGCNQVDAILAHTRAVREGFVVYDPQLLTRVRHTKPQATLSRRERLENVADAFTCTSPSRHELAAQTIYIIDDVVTTGATLSAAHDALSQHCKNIELIALARA
ncbi:MAG: ComF family protein [Candidatus Pacebacteria bacterium]|nr:ComF family protein [Candidatus Paceibacterota bacterium]